MHLVNALKEFDGKHTAPLEELASRLADDDEAVGALLVISESDEPKLQTSATWVLKRLSEHGLAFSVSQTNQLLGLLAKVASWEAKLHLLQMLPHLNIPKRKAAATFRAIATVLESEDNKFVRAWSYNGLVALADQHPDYRAEVVKVLVTGQQEKAASIKARVRNAIKAVDWLN